MSTTPYTSKGAIAPPALDKELGSARSYPIRDLVPQLANRQTALKTYNMMARTDAVTSVSLRAGKIPVQSADIYIDPVGEDDQADVIRQFVEDNLFNNITTPFSYVVTKILRMFQDGATVLNPVYTAGVWAPNKARANRKNHTMLSKLAYRPAITIDRIEYDNDGGPQIIHHNALRADGRTEQVPIPIDQAIIFQFGDADDYLGDSVLRSAYPHWYYKTYLYKIDAIQKERHGIGVPKGKLPPGAKKEDKEILKELLANLRTNEQAEMVLPAGYEVEFAKLEGQLVNVLESANHHDVLIMLNIFAEFMMLGLESSGGGRATSGAQTDVYYKSAWFTAQSICDCFNMFLIPKLVLYNFETDVFPQMKVRNIGQSRDLQQLSAALANLRRANLITGDIETENWTRNQFDMPKKTGTVDPSIYNPPPKGPGFGNQQGSVSQNGSGGQGNMKKGPTQSN